VRADFDLLMYASSESAAVAAYRSLLASVSAGAVPRADERAASNAIATFKQSVR